MRPSPFTGKFKKKQIKLDKPQQRKEQQPLDDNKYSEANTLKPPPSTSNKLIKVSRDKNQQRSSSKDPKKSIEVSKQTDEPEKVESKPLGSFKPNLKLKMGNKIKLTSNNESAEQKKQQLGEAPPSQQFRPVARPPLLKKRLGDKADLPSQRQAREQVIIEDQNRSPHNVEEDSHEGSQSFNQSMSIAPKFKIKPKNEQPQHFPLIQEQPMEQTGFGVTNFADLKIETREFNFDAAETKVSEVKIQKQQARAKDLKNLLNLQIDLYEQTLNISCVTPYEIYINKIKSGSMKNSNDQAFDEKTSSGCQTLALQFDNFMNQCPQDYYIDINSITQTDQHQAFSRFLTKYSPVMEQLIRPSTSIVMPPIFLLALRPQFRKLLTCPFPIFVYHSPSLNLGIAVIGQKLYIAQCQIESVLVMGSVIVAGSCDGVLYVWGGRNDRGSRLYRKVHEITQSTNFQLAEYSTEDLDRFSIYRGCEGVVAMLGESSEEMVSLSSSGKVVKWRLERNTGKPVTLKPESSYQFADMIQRPNLLAYDIKKRNSNYFINTSAGILVWNGEQITQRIDTERFRVCNFTLPHRTHFIYAVCDDLSLRIFEQHYANELYKVRITGTGGLVDIHVPEIQYDNKKLSITSSVYVIGHSGSIYYVNLLRSPTEAKTILGAEDAKAKDIIYKGVNKLNRGFEVVTLWRDLKCTSQQRKMDINLELNVANVKNILEENRQVHSWLEAENSLTTIQ